MSRSTIDNIGEGALKPAGLHLKAGLSELMLRQSDLCDSSVSSVYLHVPFCVAKCPYCAFSSALLSAGDEELYLSSLAVEIEQKKHLTCGIKTLYIGGGTPTVLSPTAWRTLIDLLESSFIFDSDAEVTVEANPGSLSFEQIKLWRDWRVSRVSIGVQSFDNSELAYLGRVHDRDMAAEAISSSLAAGFSTSADLIFGLPGGTLRNWARTVRELLALHPHHISIYQLTLEPGTPFGAKDPQELPDGYSYYRYAQWMLPKKGFHQYEVASFALKGHESRHNLNYWSDGSYLGLGPSAWGYTSGSRCQNAPSLHEYARMLREGSASVYEEHLDAEAAARQAAVLALRTFSGINWHDFLKVHGTELADEIRGRLALFPTELVICNDERACLTPHGMRVANMIWEELI